VTADAELGERAGFEARSMLGIAEDAPVDDILAALERSTGLIIFVVPLGGDGIAGAYQSKLGQEWVIINVDNSVERQRFTLAHEFGHHYLGHGSTFDTTAYLADRQPKEVQANYFAGALLVSPAALDQALERLDRPQIEFDVLVALAVYFGISSMSMRIRLETLGRLRRSEIQAFDSQIDAGEHKRLGRPRGMTPIIDSLVSAKREGGRAPTAMLDRALAAAEHGLIPEDRLADLLHIPAEAVAAQREHELVSE
jgi:Zn-dependent peptidase ImmA (M78 family)